MRINRYEDISEIEREAKKDYIDRHSAFVHCKKEAQKGKKFKVKIKVGEEYTHPDDFDHYISYVQLWDGERMLAQAHFSAGVLANESGHVEVKFYIVPTRNMKLLATAYCTKHGLWHSDEVEVTVS